MWGSLSICGRVDLRSFSQDQESENLGSFPFLIHEIRRSRAGHAAVPPQNDSGGREQWSLYNALVFEAASK
jgi:hypothetical protein